MPDMWLEMGMVEDNILLGNPTRRSVVATLCGGCTVGIAGCSGNDGSGDTTQPTDSPTAQTDGGTRSPDEGPESLIPGEVVHDELDGIEVQDHWATADGVRIRIRNTGDEALTYPGGQYQAGRHVWGRSLSEDGNEVFSAFWNGNTGTGPSEVAPGTEATIGFPIDAGNADRYELCFAQKEAAGVSSWEQLCGDG